MPFASGSRTSPSNSSFGSNVTLGCKEYDEESIWDVFDDLPTTAKSPQQTSSCPKHDNFIIDYVSGSRVCGNCGVIIKKQMIDQEAEWRNLETNNQFSSDPIRCATINPLLPNSSLSTKIVTHGRETSHLSRLNRWQSMPHSERSAYEVFQEIDSKGRDHNVCSAVLMSAKQFYLRVSQKNTALQVKGEKREGLRGGKRQGLIAACLLYACKQHNMPQSQAQIAEILNYKKSDVTRGSNIFLNLIKNDPSLTSSVNDIIDGHHFIRHFGMMLDVDYFIIKYSIEVYDYVKKMGILTGNTAPSIASGCIFLVLECFCPGLHETTIANSCGISKVTVLNVYKQLIPHKLQLLTFVFGSLYCHKTQIDNPITVSKIHKLCKKMSVSPDFGSMQPQVLAATVIYYVMTRIYGSQTKQTGLENFKGRFWNAIRPFNESDLVDCGRKIIWFQNDIDDFFFAVPVMPKVLQKDMIIKQDGLLTDGLLTKKRLKRDRRNLEAEDRRNLETEKLKTTFQKAPPQAICPLTIAEILLGETELPEQPKKKRKYQKKQTKQTLITDLASLNEKYSH